MTLSCFRSRGSHFGNWGLAIVLAAGLSTGCPDSTVSPVDAGPTFDALAGEDVAASDGSGTDSSTEPWAPDPNWESCGAEDELIRGIRQPAPEGCERYLGSVDFIYANFTRQNPLEAIANLHAIDGYLLFGRSTDLFDFAGLERLEYVGQTFRVVDSRNLATLEHLSGLREVGGELFLGLTAVENLRGLEGLQQVGSLRLYLPAVSSLDGLSGLRRIRGDVVVDGVGVPRSEVEAFFEGIEVDGEVIYDEASE